MTFVFYIVLGLMVGAETTVRAIVFDCDGVLVDSENLKFEAWREVLSEVGVTMNRAEYLDVVGQDNHAILRRVAKTHHARLDESLIAKKESAYHRRQKKGLKLIEPAVAFVHYLKAHQGEFGMKLGLASSASRAEILENLKQARLDQIFDRVVSGLDDLKDVQDPNGTNKPAPYIYLKIARQLGVIPREVLVFEDSGAGVDAGVRAGMPVIAVPNEFTRLQPFGHAKRVADLNAGPEALARRFFVKPSAPLILREAN